MLTLSLPCVPPADESVGCWRGACSFGQSGDRCADATGVSVGEDSVDRRLHIVIRRGGSFHS